MASATYVMDIVKGKNVGDRAAKDAPGERHHELLLDDPVERACTVLRIVA